MPRPSPVRDAVRSVLLGERRHALTLDDLQAAVRARGVPADPSSVFRAVTHLEREHVVTRVSLGDGQARFEAPSPHHEHVVCRVCGAVEAVPGCLLASVRSGVEAATGFSVETHDVVLSGRCPGCRAEASS